MNCELPDVQAGFRKGRGTRNQIANIHWIIEKAREFQEKTNKQTNNNISFCFIDYAKVFDCVDYNKLENSTRDGDTRPPDLPLEKSVCRSGSNRQNWTLNNRLVPNRNNIQPWLTPFPIWNQSVVPCPVLTVASWPAYTFLRRQIRWSGIPISWRVFHSLLWSTVMIHTKALV